MRDNPFLHFYKDGELDYSNVKLYELKIDDRFTQGAARHQLTFALDEDLLDTLCELPQGLSQSQPSVNDREADTHNDEERNKHENDDEESLGFCSRSEAYSSSSYEDDELAYTYDDGRVCCYDYQEVKGAKISFATFAGSIYNDQPWENQKLLFDSFITSSRKFIEVDPLPQKDFDEWKKHCTTFVKGNFHRFVCLFQTN